MISGMESRITTISPDQLARYRRTAAIRFQARRDALTPRFAQAWAMARQAARLLRERFPVTRVVVFGSLLREPCFHQWSDIDLAVWGLAPEQTVRAIGAALDLDPTFPIHLVDVTACSPALLDAILREGQNL